MEHLKPGWFKWFLVYCLLGLIAAFVCWCDAPN